MTRRTSRGGKPRAADCYRLRQKTRKPINEERKEAKVVDRDLQDYIDTLPLDTTQRQKLERLIDEDKRKPHNTDTKDWQSAAIKKA